MITQRYKYMCAHVMSPVCLHDNRHQTEHAHIKTGGDKQRDVFLMSFTLLHHSTK